MEINPSKLKKRSINAPAMAVTKRRLTRWFTASLVSASGLRFSVSLSPRSSRSSPSPRGGGAIRMPMSVTAGSRGASALWCGGE